MSTLCSFAMRRTSGDDFCRADVVLTELRGASRCDAIGRCAEASARRVVRLSRGTVCRPPRAPPGALAAAPAPSVADGWHLGRVADRRDDAVHRHGFAFVHLDLGQHARGRRRDLGVHLVGRDLEERLVAIDRVADLLDPADDRAFRNRFAHLGHHDGCGHRSFGPSSSRSNGSNVYICIAAPCVACAASPTASANVGCAWIVLISSSTVHSRRSASTASATSSVDRGPIMCTPEHLIVLLVGHDLHEPFGLAGHLRAAEHAEGERADAHVVAALLRFGLGQADAADLRVAVGAAGHVIVVDRLHVLAGNAARRR